MAKLSRKLIFPAVAILTVAFLFIEHRKFLLLIILAAISSVISFSMARRQLQFDISPVFFFSIFITNYMGFHYSLAFIAFAVTIPTILGGAVPDPTSIFFWTQLVGINLLSKVFIPLGFVQTGVVMAVLEVIGSFAINTFIMSKSPGEFAFFSVFAFIANITYFIGFGHLLVAIANILLV